MEIESALVVFKKVKYYSVKITVSVRCDLGRYTASRAIAKTLAGVARRAEARDESVENSHLSVSMWTGVLTFGRIWY